MQIMVPVPHTLGRAWVTNRRPGGKTFFSDVCDHVTTTPRVTNGCPAGKTCLENQFCRYPWGSVVLKRKLFYGIDDHVKHPRRERGKTRKHFLPNIPCTLKTSSYFPVRKRKIIFYSFFFLEKMLYIPLVLRALFSGNGFLSGTEKNLIWRKHLHELEK